MKHLIGYLVAIAENRFGVTPRNTIMRLTGYKDSGQFMDGFDSYYDKLMGKIET